MIRLGKYDTTNSPQEALYLGDPANERATRDAIHSGKAPFEIAPHEFRGHAILVGQSGTGKTETVLTIIKGALGTGMRTIVIDAKPDRDLKKRVTRIARLAGKSFDEFPGTRYNIWNDQDPQVVAVRVAELFRLSDQERPLAIHLLGEAITASGVGGAGRPTTAKLLKELNKIATEKSWSPAFHAVAVVLADQWAALNSKYRDVFTTGKGLDTPDLAYVIVDALAEPHIAAGFGRLVLRDVAASVRPPRGKIKEQRLLVFDEFSAVPNEVATDLVERIRSYNTQVLLTTQSYAGLGPDRERLVDASNVLILHRSARAGDLVAYGSTSLTSADVAALDVGMVYVLSKGRKALVKVDRV